MNRRLLSAALLVAGFVAGCGAATKTTTTSPKAAAVPAPPVNPCSVLTRHEVSVGLGVAAHAGRRQGADCTYDAGAHSLVVTAAVATTTVRQALKHSSLPHRTHLSGPGYFGEAIDLPGSQTEVSLVKGKTYLTLVLTNAKVGGKSVHGADIALGREAAQRL
jgi:hypothetical protein